MDEVTDESLKQIGRITVNYSNLELILNYCIWELLGVSENKGRVITSGMQFNLLIKMYGGLCKSGFSDSIIIKFAKDNVDRLINVSERRNHLIHSTLLFDENGSFGTFKSKSDGLKGIKTDFKELTEQDLKKLGDDIQNTCRELSRFYALINNQ